MMLNIAVTPNPNPAPKPEGDPGFGRVYTDHMFRMDYTEGIGWHDARIVPYGPIELEPSAMVLHYAQENFEGLKAYRTPDGGIQLFRPEENAARMAASCRRMCMPIIKPALWIEAVRRLVDIDRDWVPHQPGMSLYIRPFIIATEPHLGVRAARQYSFMIILSPVGNYYPTGMNPVKIYVETHYVRAVRGGTGTAKCGGNYAAGLKAQAEAQQAGYQQVLWLDGIEQKYIEEVGAMNVFFKIDGNIITPELQGSILPGITRKSCIEILSDWGYTVEERRLSLEEVAEAADEGRLEEAFGTGTAAVISPIGELRAAERQIFIGERIGPLSQRLYDELTGIQWGLRPDTRGWTQRV
jgi:branched-chain amino acid aminotransferase